MTGITVRCIALLTLAWAGTANATIIPFSATVADFRSGGAASGFPIDHGVVGTFSYDTGSVLSATVSGQWGTPLPPGGLFSTAAADIFVDGILVAQCAFEEVGCYFGPFSTWSYTFSAADLLSGVLNDGLANLSVIQQTSTSVGISSLEISGRLDDLSGNIPEPATLVLFGLGLAGLGWSRRKKA